LNPFFSNDSSFKLLVFIQNRYSWAANLSDFGHSKCVFDASKSEKSYRSPEGFLQKSSQFKEIVVIVALGI
jgi:hypothetical protein